MEAASSRQTPPLHADPVLDRDSPEYRAYYFHRFTEACYGQMKIMQEFFSDSPIVALWDRLDEYGRKRLLQFITFQRHQDLDNAYNVDTCAFSVILHLADTIKSKPPADLVQNKPPKGNALLRIAILNQHAAVIRGQTRKVASP